MSTIMYSKTISKTASLFLAFAATALGQDILDLGDNSTEAPTEMETKCRSITEILCERGAGLRALCEAISISGLNDDLEDDFWTIFSPTDEAFEALGRKNLDYLVFGNNTVPLTDLLLFHIYPGVSLTKDLLPCEAGNNLLEMANGEDSRTICDRNVGPIIQKGAFNDRDDAPRFIEMDIMACNGVVHVLDKVLLFEALPYEIPESDEIIVGNDVDEFGCIGSAGYEWCDALSECIRSWETTCESTIPPLPGSDRDEFGCIGSAGYEWCEVLGDCIRPWETTCETERGTPDLVTEPDLETEAEPEDEIEEEEEVVGVAAPQCLTIADLACSEPEFTTLCTLLQDNGLVETLNEGSWTVFAPTNEAFDAAPPLPAGAVKDILLTHVVPTELAFEDLGCTVKIVMANDSRTRTVCRDGVTYQKGRGNSDEQRPAIIAYDIEACNGLIHAVDQVILPDLD